MKTEDNDSEFLDQVFRQKINTLLSSPPNAGWNASKGWLSVEKGLRTKRKKKKIWGYIPLTACFLLLVGGSLYLFSFVRDQQREISALKQQINLSSQQKDKKKTYKDSETLDVASLEKNTEPIVHQKEQVIVIDRKDKKNPLQASAPSTKKAVSPSLYSHVSPQSKIILQKEAGERGKGHSDIITDYPSTENQPLNNLFIDKRDGSTEITTSSSLLTLAAKGDTSPTPTSRAVTVYFPADSTSPIQVVDHSRKEKKERFFRRWTINGYHTDNQDQSASSSNFWVGTNK